MILFMIWYIDIVKNFVYEMTLLHISQSKPEMNVSATVGMSRGNVSGGMSTTVGEMSATVGNLNMIYEI